MDYSSSHSFPLQKIHLSRVIRGSFLVAGTAIGAGMLGIPLLTAKAGFLPACFITILVWGFMLCTGLLFLEATLWMPAGSNLLSLSQKFFGKQGRSFAGLLFVFLYYCLLVAYFAAGAPLLVQILQGFFGMQIEGVLSYVLFGGIFAFIVFLGAKWVDGSNFLLTIGLIASYLLLISIGAPQVDAAHLKLSHWEASFFAAPVLFSAFGFHNIIPSLCTYFEKDRTSIKLSIIVGITFALVVYLAWQWLVIGSVPQESLKEALNEGQPATIALQSITAHPWIFRIGQAFSFFALVTSLLGVALSMVDFLADGMKLKRVGVQRIVLVLLTFFPPLILAAIDPTIFDKALGIAGGFGEALLNGLIPVALVWIGKYTHGLSVESRWLGRRFSLAIFFLAGLFVMALEIINLL